MSTAQSILLVKQIDITCLVDTYQPHGLTLEAVAEKQAIPGSHWGESEAGLIKHTLYYRQDTPVHSVLHEAGHWLMMSVERRDSLHTDAKGTQAEEDAVCYLQVLISDLIPQMGRERMFEDMDSWGYNFMAGSTREWFYKDASDAEATLLQRLQSQPLLATQLGFASTGDMP
jgi:hypothetical protein